jgi:hypothetical protein
MSVTKTRKDTERRRREEPRSKNVARVPKSRQGRTQSDLSLLVEEEVQVGVAIVWVLLLPLPAQELPVELGTPEQSIAETASIGCESASLGHTDTEDAASEA